MATIIDPPNSVWPNGLKVDSEGYVTFYPLGTNKVDISTITWPDGDKLISPFVYQNDKLVGFVDTKALTVSGSATTTMNYNHIEADFASISEGALTVNAPNATVKKFTWAVSTGGDETFDFVIIDFNTADEEIINTVRTAKRVVDNKLYDADDNLIGTWDTSKLEVGGFEDEETGNFDGLFNNKTEDSWTSRGIILSEFDSDLPSLTNGNFMFFFCENLTSFSSDLPSLTDGTAMFSACHNLTSFSSDLSSLTNGHSMFYGCKLDGPSVRNIIETINKSSDSSDISIGIGCDSTNEDASLFFQEAGYDDIESFEAALEATGWEVDIQLMGRPTTTYGLRKPSGNTLPVFAKLEETEKYTTHISIDGSKKYTLRWFHMTTGSTEGYTQFNSLEEAIEHFNIKPIERN